MLSFIVETIAVGVSASKGETVLLDLKYISGEATISGHFRLLRTPPL